MLLTGAAADEAALVPRETLFAPPGRTRLQISPDATRVAWLAREKGSFALHVSGLDGTANRSIAAGVQSFRWAPDGKTLLFSKGHRLHQVDPSGNELRALTPKGVAAKDLVLSPRQPATALIELNQRGRPLFDVHRIDLATGELSLDTENPGDVIGWVADLELRVRAAVASDPRDGSKHLRARVGDGWKTIAVWPFEEEGGVVGFTNENRSLLVETSVGADTTRLFQIDAATGEEEKLVAHDPRADVGRVILHPATGVLQAVSSEFLQPEWKIIDPSIRADVDALAATGAGPVWILSRDAADEVWAVALEKPDGRVDYAIFHRAQGTLTPLFGNRPGLDSFALATRRGLLVPTADGASLPSYLTLPATGASEKLPLVLAIHGGPWLRDQHGWDPSAQWLANRGYAVLQVNFRGSAGFGKQFLHAGDRGWGPGVMQRDLAEAARWAVAQGIADPARIAVYGASFGGQATVASLAFSPELYAAGVALSAPLDLRTLVASVPPEWAPLRKRLAASLGDVEHDEVLNRALSPLYHAAAVRAPLLLAQGADDPRVRPEQAKSFAASLRERDVPVEVVIYSGEGRSLEKPANRMDFYARVEAFLAQHLGGRAQP
jgi:dipeptidyl aminopeptidase/acylaminoacyl peptidase